MADDEPLLRDGAAVFDGVVIAVGNGEDDT